MDSNPLISVSHEPLSTPFVFLSYAKEDQARVDKIYRRLRGDNLKPWIDHHQLRGGHDWDRVIRATIRKCPVFAVFLSRRSVKKRGYLQREIKEALDVVDELPEDTAFILPLRLDDCDIPDRLRRWHCLDLFRPGGYDRLRTSLIERLGPIYAPPRRRTTRVMAIPAFEEPADGVLFQHFLETDTFRHGMARDGRHVVSDGSFMFFRQELPDAFLSLKTMVLNSGEMKIGEITNAMPDSIIYRQDRNIIRTYLRGAGDDMTLVSLCDDNQCTVDARNWRLVDLFLRRYRA